MQSPRYLHDVESLFSSTAALPSRFHEVRSARSRHDWLPALDARPGPRQALRRLVDVLLGWHERARQRRALMELNDRMLADIGITRADVWIETEKPFWRA